MFFDLRDAEKEVLANCADLELFFDFFLECSGVGFALLTHDYFFLKTNAKFNKIFGLTSSFLVGKKLTYLLNLHQINLDLDNCEDVFLDISKFSRDVSVKKMSVRVRIYRPNRNSRFVFFEMVDVSDMVSLNQEAKKNIQIMEKKILDLEFRNKCLEQQNLKDYLTGINNRKSFSLQIAKEVDRVDRFFGNGLSLLLIDIDFFKKYNDDYGHLEGDKMLKLVALLIQNNSRTYDFVSRYGGEEFAVILPNTNLRDAFFVAERMRKKVEKNFFDGKRITISVGIGFWNKSMSIEDFINDADLALYTAKKNGRNNVFPKIKLGGK